MKITKTDQLPEWYDLKKYQGADALDARGWWRQIRARRNIYKHLVSARKAARNNNNYQSYEALLYEQFLKLASDPLALHTITQEDRSFSPEPCSIPTYYDLRYLLVEANVEEDSESELDSAISSPSQVLLFINLAYSDQSIIQDLQGTLTLIRARLEKEISEGRLFNDVGYPLTSKPARKRTYEINKWAECGLLPFMDLRLWEKFSGNSITWKVISEATDTRENASENQTRQTVAVLADELLFVGNGRYDFERILFEGEKSRR